MIKEKCFTKEWLETFKKQKEHKDIQTNILEKMIHALNLLGLLKKHGLDFVFKGGTSLILLLDESNRFSIDIDIICKEDREVLEVILDEIVENSRFTSVSLDERRSYNEGIPKAHYIFEYESVFNTKKPGKILLDILIEDSHYPQHEEKPIKAKWIETEEQLSVKTPTIDAITGDKLTAFAPNTVGIPYFKGKDSFSMEICKQLFDLSRLFGQISDINKVSESFQTFAEQEIGYRNKDDEFKKKEITAEKILQDTIDTCITLTKRDSNKTEPEKSNFLQLQNGIKSFGSGYLISGKFRIEDAVSAVAKIAYLAAKLLKKDLSKINYYDGSDNKSPDFDDPDWIFINRLKKFPEKSVFYYWTKTVELLTK